MQASATKKSRITSADQPLFQCRVNQAPSVTYANFQRLAKERGWTEAWLAAQLRPHVDDPQRIAHELFSGEGRQRPFTEDYDPQTICDLSETVIPYACALQLYNNAIAQAQGQPGQPSCRCQCGQRVQGKQKYASQACQKRDYRRALSRRRMTLEPASGAGQNRTNGKVAIIDFKKKIF